MKKLSFLFSLIFALVFSNQVYGMLLLGHGTETAGDGWRKCELTVNASKVPGDLTNFPILLTEGNLPSECLDKDGSYPSDDGGGNIQFWDTEAGANRYDCEIVTFTTHNDPASGKAEIWVETPAVNGTVSTTFWIWYAKSGESQPAANATYGSEAVWDANFKMVQHMNEDPSDSAPQMIDSTSNDNDGTSAGTMLTEDLVAAQIGNGLDFEGTDDYIDINFDPGGTITVSAWTYQASLTSQKPICCFDDPPTNRSSFTVQSDGDTLFVNNDAYIYHTSGIGSGNQQYVVLNADETDIVNTKVYVNGAEKSEQSTNAGTETNFNRVQIGHGESYGQVVVYFDGIIDEFRVSNITRSANWGLACYNNQYSPSTFVAAGTPGGGAGADPPTVTTQAVDGIHDNNATGHGTIGATGGANATTKGICWSTAPTPTTEDNTASDSGSYGTGVFSKLITGLSANTTHYVRAYAINSAGTGYGDQVEFDTTGAPPSECNNYVDTGGDDSTGNGTITNPWLTVGYTLSQTDYGEMVCVNAGTYAESQLIVPSGVNVRSTSENATKVIIVPNYSSAEPTSALIKLSSTPGTNNPAGNTISYLTLDGNGTSGSYSVGAAVYVYDRDNVEICHCTIKDCKWASTSSNYNAIKVRASASVAEWDVIWPDDCGLDGVDTAFDANWPASAVNHVEGFSLHDCNITNCGITAESRGTCVVGLWCVKDSTIYSNTIDATGKPGTQCIGGGAGSGPTSCLWNVDIYSNTLSSRSHLYALGVPSSCGTIELWVMRSGCEFYGNICNHGWSVTVSKNLSVHDNVIISANEPDSCGSWTWNDDGRDNRHSWGFEFDVASYGRLYNNYIANTIFLAKVGCGSGSNIIVRDTQVFNNIGVNMCNQGISVYAYNGASIQGLKVFNNTFDGAMSVDPDPYGNFYYGIVKYQIEDSGSEINATEIYNNLATDFRGDYFIRADCKDEGAFVVDTTSKYNMYDKALTFYYDVSDRCTADTTDNSNNSQKVIAFAEGAGALGYKLTASSNATDAGTNSGVNGTVTDDYWGTGRPVNSIYDIGAHEYSP